MGNQTFSLSSDRQLNFSRFSNKQSSFYRILAEQFFRILRWAIKFFLTSSFLTSSDQESGLSHILSIKFSWGQIQSPWLWAIEHLSHPRDGQASLSHTLRPAIKLFSHRQISNQALLTIAEQSSFSHITGAIKIFWGLEWGLHKWAEKK